MSVQLSYGQQPQYSLGTINGVSPHSINTVIATEDIQFGSAMLRDGTVDVAAAAGVLFAVAVSQASVEADYPYTSNLTWVAEQAVGAMRDGVVTVEVTDPVVAGDAVKVTDTGIFTNDAGAGVAVSNAVFESDSVSCDDADGTTRQLALLRVFFAAGV